MNHQCVLADLHPLAEPANETPIAAHRVVEVLRRGPVGSAEAGQIEGDRRAPHPLQEGRPILGVRRVAVDEEHRRAASGQAAEERGDAVDDHASGLDARGQYPRAVPSEPPWRRPRRRRVIAIRDRLRELYGRPITEPHGHPIAELVRTVLSQNTSDRNRDVAYDRLRRRFGTWEEVRDAPPAEVVEAIKPGGLSATKGPRIQQILERLGDHPDLDWLEDAPREEALEFLCDLPGVGRKTAACVLIFAFGRPEIPVDTHVHRVGGRLGLFPPDASFNRAHDEMLAVTPPEDAYELHINLIRHGRAVCRPRPRCLECGLRRMCPWYRDWGAAADMLPRQR
jgi:endonuclease-3